MALQQQRPMSAAPTNMVAPAAGSQAVADADAAAFSAPADFAPVPAAPSSSPEEELGVDDAEMQRIEDARLARIEAELVARLERLGSLSPAEEARLRDVRARRAAA